MTVLGFESECVVITSGVSQGSHLKPILFIIFINDFPDCLVFVSCYIHADDVKFYTKIVDLGDYNFQEDLQRIEGRALENYLRLNLSKCCTMTSPGLEIPFSRTILCSIRN